MCHVSNINAVFQPFRCPNCDTLLNKAIILERHLTICSEPVRDLFCRNIYENRDSLSDKLDFFGIKYTSQPKLFNNLRIFDFESICVPEKTFKDTKTRMCIGNLFPMSATISSDLVAEPVFPNTSDPHLFVTSGIRDLGELASPSKAQKKLFFPDIETTMKIKLDSTLEKLAQRRNRRERTRSFDMSQYVCDKICASIQLLHINRSQIFDYQESLERLWNALPVMDLSSATYDLNLIKSYRTWYRFLLTNKILNLPLSKKRTSSFH